MAGPASASVVAEGSPRSGAVITRHTLFFSTSRRTPASRSSRSDGSDARAWRRARATWPARCLRPRGALARIARRGPCRLARAASRAATHAGDRATRGLLREMISRLMKDLERWLRQTRRRRQPHDPGAAGALVAHQGGGGRRDVTMACGDRLRSAATAMAFWKSCAAFHATEGASGTARIASRRASCGAGVHWYPLIASTGR